MTMSQTYTLSVRNTLAQGGSLARRLTATPRDTAASVARLTLAVVLFPHGAQHALGWFGGYGFQGTLAWMTGSVGFPAPLAALAIVTELLAPVLLAVGLGGRLAAAGLFGLMLGAISTHLENGFFMNWFGSMAAGREGYEYHLLVLALAAVVMIKGSGAGSVDRLLVGRAPKDA
ncbi:MAG TPA: DoxX family protein [Polyangiaceae bacterium]|nr:DoxX family protein [Polyangiaceae bacterium]